jgi:glycosyltransferase involved in cell wall biosynthesis
MNCGRCFFMVLAVNTRVVAFQTGGQQRVAAEIKKRLGVIEEIKPSKPLGGVQGHIWEQTVLPYKAQGRWLWSPSATGPIGYARQVVTVHDIAFLDLPQYFSAPFRLLYSALVPALMRRVAKVVTVSEFSRQRIIERLSLEPEKIVVIENGVSEHFRPQSPAAIERAKAELELPDRYFLLQATSDKRKNLAGALEAWRMALPALPDDLWLVVSGSRGRAHVFGDPARVEAPRRTRFLGYVAEERLAPLIAGAEAFLFPSLYEGFGMPILEAMACGTPVLTSDATATKEVAGDSALLIDPHDSASIARGVVLLATGAALRVRLRASGLCHAARFGWDDIAVRYRALFESLEAAHAAPDCRL